MDISQGLQHWLDRLALSLSPAQRKTLMQKLAQGLRLRTRQRITAQQDPDGNQFIPRKRQQIRRIRRDAMFSKLSKKIKTQVSADHLAVGLSGRDGKIARIHHYGLSDKPSRTQNPVRYAKRELIGFSDDDQQWIKQHIQEFISNST
jgi:phage virion morphogenesis protein